MGPFSIGRITLYFGLAWSVYVSIKAFYEVWRHAKTDFKLADDQYEANKHKRSHIAALLGIACYSLYDVFSYVWFDIKAAQTLEEDDRTIGVFNILFVNILWLILINHFKHERTRTIEKGTWLEILRF